ncbi:MAG: polysaccharide biosynthesis/export family protein [Terriglobales bacterium]
MYGRAGIIGYGLACVLVLAISASAQGATAPLQEATPPVVAQTLEPGDLIAVRVTGAPELQTEARLTAGGSFTMPEAGTLTLAGDSAAQAGQALAARLRQTYLLDPQVQVLVKQFAPQPVTVAGAVVTPGVYSARSYPDLGAMLAAAGGLRASAGGQILIQPAGGDAAEAIPVTAFERGGARYVRLRAGEMIRVAQAATVYVAGNVVRPGAYPLPPAGLTMLEAISLAGGTRRDSRLNHTRIVHRNLDGDTKTVWVNAGHVMQGEAPDPQLRPYDLVYVPWSPGKADITAGIQLAAATVAQIIFGVIVFHWSSPPAQAVVPNLAKLPGQ